MWPFKKKKQLKEKETIVPIKEISEQEQEIDRLQAQIIQCEQCGAFGKGITFRKKHKKYYCQNCI